MFYRPSLDLFLPSPYAVPSFLYFSGPTDFRTTAQAQLLGNPIETHRRFL